jgi:hypothetical protein
MIGDIIILASVILCLIGCGARLKNRILRDKGFPEYRRKEKKNEGKEVQPGHPVPR